MITLKYIASFTSAQDLDKMAQRPPELLQMIQLVYFWATQHNIVVEPVIVDSENFKITYTFNIPDQTTWDNIIAHANDNGIDIFDLGDQTQAFVEANGGTFQRVVEGA